jgi:hypothetical protein
MSIATLAAWLVTVSIGGYMLRTWIVRGGFRRQRMTGAGVPPQVVFGHAGFALTGLTVWIVYLGTGWRPLAWLDVGVIGAAISLGICMVTLWTPYPIRIPAGPGDEPPPATPLRTRQDAFTVTDEMIASLLAERPPASRRPQRQHLLPLIPACHGATALTTFLLATLSAVLPSR